MIHERETVYYTCVAWKIVLTGKSPGAEEIGQYENAYKQDEAHMKVQVSVMKAMLALRRMNIGIIEFVPALPVHIQCVYPGENRVNSHPTVGFS